MKKASTVAILVLLCGNGFSQQRIIGDSIRVLFLKNHNKNLLQERSDFDYLIVVTNISSKPVRAYRELLYGRMPSPLANYDCPLYEKDDTGFRFVDHYSYEPPYQYLMDSLRQIYSDSVANSIIKDFDFHKYILEPGESDTLQFNLLCNNFYLEPGQYKFKIAFRIGSSDIIDEAGTRKKNLLYIWSDWFYFKLDRKLVCSLSK